MLYFCYKNVKIEYYQSKPHIKTHLAMIMVVWFFSSQKHDTYLEVMMCLRDAKHH